MQVIKNTFLKQKLQQHFQNPKEQQKMSSIQKKLGVKPAIVKPKPRKSHIPTFTPLMEEKINQLLEKVILKVVMTPGGGLNTVVHNTPQPIELPSPTIDEFKKRAMKIIKDFFTAPNFEEREECSEFILIEDIFPMYKSDRDVGDVTDEIYCKIQDIVMGPRDEITGEFLAEKEEEEEGDFPSEELDLSSDVEPSQPTVPPHPESGSETDAVETTNRSSMCVVM